MKQFFPILEWLPNYSKKQASSDLIAGLTVGMMLIPQGMAYAMLAGMPAIYGLYASIVPLIVYSIFGTSRQLAVGPVAMVSLLVAAAISSLEITDPNEYVQAALLLSLMIGLIQFILGIVRLGFLVNFLSHPVISGFTSAAALIIGLNQLKHLFGLSIPKSNFVHEILINTTQDISSLNPYALAIGVGAMALIILVKKWNKAIPGPLLAVILGIAIVWSLRLDLHGVSIVKEVPEGLPSFGIPTINFKLMDKLMPMAVTIALIAYMESIAVAKAIQKRHRNYKVSPNQELIGLGLANIFGSFFQAFPTTGGFSRTAVNDQAGAKTGMAAIISALVIAISLLFLTPLFYYLPKAILASIIMVAVFGLIDWREIKHLYKTDRYDLAMLLVTFITTLGFGIEKGILTGVALSILMIILKTTRPHYAILGQVSLGVYRNVKRFPKAQTREDVLIFRFDARIYFANVQFLQDKLEEETLKKGASLKHIIIDTESINDIDSSGMHLLWDLAKSFKEKGIQIHYTGIKGPVRDKMAKAGYNDFVGSENFHLRISDAEDSLKSIDQTSNRDDEVLFQNQDD